MSVNSKMTAIADEIRELSGTEEAMGLDAMASTLNAENTNFASNLTTQDNLISQIQTALQNKSAATGEDVTSETNAYTTKIATLETAITALETELQGKASSGSGGGNIETCTVTIIPQGLEGIRYIAATQYNNGQVNGYYDTPENGITQITIENVVCNSNVIFQSSVLPVISAYSINGTAKLLHAHEFNTPWAFQTPSVSGEKCTITVWDDD